MRPELLDPIGESQHHPEALHLAREIYRLYEAGDPYDAELKHLGLIARRPIHAFEVDAAFGSTNSDDFARKMLVNWHTLPDDLAEQEMLELVVCICEVHGDAFQLHYWMKCLEINTGDVKISDLIYWPGTYFADGNDAREMSPSEILKTALAARALGT